MKACIAFVPVLGGVGQTTVLAALGHVWAARGLPALAVDLCAQNALAHHCGAETGLSHGWALQVLQGLWWGEAAQENSAGLRFIPYGDVTLAGRDSLHALQTRVSEPDWLRAQLEALVVPTNALVLLDAPAWPGVTAFQAAHCARLVVVVVESTARAVAQYETLLTLQSQLAPGVRMVLLPSRFDPRRASHAQAMAQLRAQWSEQLCPYALHEDDSVASAFAQGGSVARWAPHSQAAHDLQGISQWLLARV